MRVLITGSSGQIGTNLALRLIGDRHEVFGVDKRANTWTDKFHYILQDLGIPYLAHSKGMGEVDYPKSDVVVHFAAHAKVHQLIKEPRRALQNIIMTHNVLEYCRLTRTPIVFSSSREVYGDVHRFSTEETSADFAYTESTYSAGKIANEAMIYSYARCYDLDYLVFRFSNVYGRFDSDLERMERVIPLFIRKIANDEPITIFGREKVLDFTFVDDCVEGVVLGLKALVGGSVKNETVNLACGQGNSLVRVAELVGKALGKTPAMDFAPTQVGEVNRYVADISRARTLLGYAPKVALDEGIPRCVEWNRQWDRPERPHLQSRQRP